MKTLAFLLIIVSVLSFNCKKNTNKFINNLSNQDHKSVSYKLLEKSYNSNISDTTVTPYDVFLIKNSTQNSTKEFVWVENNYRPYSLIFNSKNYYLVMPTKKKTRLYEKFDEAYISSNDWIENFLTSDSILSLLNKNYQLSLNDTLFDGEKCINLTVNYPGNKKTINYIFNKNSFFPIYSKQVIVENKTSYSDELYFSEIIYDQVNFSELNTKLNKLLKKNPAVPYNAESTEVITENMLQIGNVAPNILGKDYLSNENFDLSKYIGKYVIVLDFWYTHCSPCVRAIPALSAFYLQNKSKDLKIFGINSIDNNKKNEDFLKSFISKRNISYNIILTDSLSDNNFKIIAYPSMYVIDKSGKIAYVEVGFSKENFEELKTKVNKLLNQQ